MLARVLGWVFNKAAGRRMGETCTGVPAVGQLAGKKQLHR